ncbi:hypothetical protein GCM10023335_55760 [Streptomyces siamensis]|uniref:Uncharacterized protein n=1 Tax=Streptomyces siamensis TaxID=1274986 RepID=A0ABP9J9D4_9ACTN
MTADEDKPYGTEQDPYAPAQRPGREPVYLRLVDGAGSGCPRTAGTSSPQQLMSGHHRAMSGVSGPRPRSS